MCLTNTQTSTTMQTWQVPVRVFIGIAMVVGTFIVVPIRVLVNYKNGGRYFFVNMSKFTDFGLCVKTKLLQTGKEQKWLENAVSEKTGLYVDNGYMYKILTGQRNSPQIVDAICEILEIEKE